MRHEKNWRRRHAKHGAHGEERGTARNTQRNNKHHVERRPAPEKPTSQPIVPDISIARLISIAPRRVSFVFIAVVSGWASFYAISVYIGGKCAKTMPKN